MNSSSGSLILGVFICAGLITGGYFIEDGLFRARSSERYVSVRGLAEREVPADLVVWPVVFQGNRK